jgi:hypothetical protein
MKTPGPFDAVTSLTPTPHEPIETNMFTDGGLEAIIDESQPKDSHRRKTIIPHVTPYA